MRQNSRVVLVDGSMSAVGSNVSEIRQWNGGQAVCLSTATTYAPIVNLMMVSPNGVDLKVGSITGNDLVPNYLPEGSYPIHSATGSSLSLNVILAPTP